MGEQTFEFLSGGGQMAKIIREKNWEHTSIGNLGQWPVSLRNTVAMLLRAKLPMLLWWGPDYVQIYNDAYGASLSPDKRFSRIGESGSISWTPDWPKISAEISQVIETGEATIQENVPVTIYTAKSSDSGFWSFSYNPVFDDYGNIYGVLEICSDTTDTVLIREKELQTQQQVLSVFEESPVGIAIFGKDRLIFQMANTFYGYLVDRRPEDIIGKPLFEALPELAGQGFEYLLEQVFVTGEPYIAKDVRVELLRNNRLDIIYVDLTYQPRKEADGQISGIFVVCVDVTAQVLSRLKIEDSEKILRDMILSAPVGICLLNTDLVCESVNDSFLEVAGKKYEEIFGKNYWIPFAEAREYYEDALDNVVNNGVPFFANEVPLMLIRHGKEEHVYVTFAYIPLVDTSGKVRNVAVWVIENTRQVTERKKVEEMILERTNELRVSNNYLTETNKLLERSNNSLESFAYVASHDLQEPLRKIQQFGDLLKREADIKNSRQAMLIDKMLAGTERMSVLIRDLLDFSKISHQRAVTKLISINKIIDQVLVTLETVIVETKAIIEIEQLPEIPADPMQMDQLFQNLLSNAIKFTKADTPPLIKIHSQKVESKYLPSNVIPVRQSPFYHRVDIEDNGIGFEEQYTNRIFQIFQRLHGKSEYAGTGIGLAISEKVVINHGGALTARSQPGVGSTFSIYLPIIENENELLSR